MSGLNVICVLFLLQIRGSLEIVDCGPPSYSIQTDQECIELGDVYPPPGTTEGSNYTISCKTLLVRTMAIIDYCPVGVCESNGQWTVASLSCGSSECANISSSNYEGRRVCTTSGRTCQRWDSQSPHTHGYTDYSLFPDNSTSNAGSYCRDPGNVRGSPWCYTMDPEVEWETCDIPMCGGMSMTQGTCTNNYCGDPDLVAETDHVCTAGEMPSHDRNTGSLLKGHCTSLLAGFTSFMAYCPVSRCLNTSYWTQAFSLGCGENECYIAGQSDEYSGGRTCTTSGWACQSWDSQTPHGHAFSLPGVGALCRDPGQVVGQPWCFINVTGDSIPEWEPCEIPECSTKIFNSGTCITTSTSSITPIPLTTTTTTTIGTTTTTTAPTTTPASTSRSTTIPITTTLTTITTTGETSTTQPLQTTTTLTPPPTTITTLPTTTTSLTTEAPITSASIFSNTTAATVGTTIITTMTSALIIPGIPVPGAKYLRITEDVNGYREQYTVPRTVSSIRCGQHCNKEPLCVFFTIDVDHTCTLFEVDISSNITLACSTPLKCYIHESNI